MARTSESFPCAAKQARESATSGSWEFFISGGYHHYSTLATCIRQTPDAAASDRRPPSAANYPVEACTEPAQSKGKTEWVAGKYVAGCDDTGGNAAEDEADSGLTCGGTQERLIRFCLIGFICNGHTVHTCMHMIL
jgi:hypothetical protein